MASESQVTANCGLLALVLGFSCGCSIDERQLQLATGSGGMAGSSDTPGGGGSDAPEPSTAGAAGGAAMDGLVEGCADLDTDGVADCKVSLVTNPTLTSDVSGWIALDDADLIWDAKNALSDLPSGSAKLSVAAPRSSAFQCLVLEGERLVIAYANAFVEPPSEGSEAGEAELEVSFFGADDCSSERTSYFRTPPSTVTGAWTTIQAGGISKPTTHSLSIELVGTKAPAAAFLSVYFDNVMLKAVDP